MIEKDIQFLSGFFRQVLHQVNNPQNQDAFRLEVNSDPYRGEPVRDDHLTEQRAEAGQDGQAVDLSGTIRVQYVLTEEDCTFSFYSDDERFLGQISLI